MAKRYSPKYDWSWQVGKMIVSSKDRAAIMRELDGHIEDRIEAYMEAGLSHEEAAAKAQAAMGDPEEIGQALARIHKPWLHILLTASKVWLVLCIALALLMPGQGVREIRPLFGEPDDLYAEYVEKAQADGYTVERLPDGGSFTRGTYTVEANRIFLAHRNEERRLLVEVQWTADRYRNDLGYAFDHLSITDADENILCSASDRISYGARETLQYFWFELPESVQNPLYLRYDFGGIHESAVIGDV